MIIRDNFWHADSNCFFLNLFIVLEAKPMDVEKEDTSEMEYELSRDLVQFMHSTVPYTVKRLLVADLKSIYVGGGENETNVDPNPFNDNFSCTPNDAKGGVRLTNNITYNW